MSERIHQLLKKVKQNHLESILITSQANVYYLSNYYTDPHERVIAVYLSEKSNPLLIVPAMEVNDAKSAGWEYDLIGYHDHENPWELFKQFLSKNNDQPKTMGLEHQHVTLNRFEEIKQTFSKTELVDAQEIIAMMRLIKNESEYTLLKEAAELADFGVATGIKAIEEGKTELELIATIEYELKKQGVQQMSFSTMALSGDKTASPHGTPGLKKITPGDLVLFDLGVIHAGYCSDITRTVSYKSITDEQQKIYETVLHAEQKAIQTATLGTAVGKMDQAARNHIQAAGYGEYFNHRIGHGLGIEVHEYPSMHENNELPIQTGMCFTIEPGIYVPHIGGVRIEDMIFITDKGAEILTKSPKELQIIG
ncbi:M24 family metallopeptidase [Virgibacillus soli]|uniref:M24 family metallopeptidase n=1 Tax=Paracerasibacillus soli TaxID=480284 RepID=UPI0035EA9AEF